MSASFTETWTVLTEFHAGLSLPSDRAITHSEWTADGMKPYIGLVHQRAGSAYGITFPDAPGCFSAADSLDDLFVMADEALELWIETQLEDRTEILSPRDLSTIRRDENWAEAFADAVLVIAVQSPLQRLRTAA